MAYRYDSSIVLLLIGFGWLMLASFIGVGMVIGLILGTPMPPWVRPAHVHAALVGGVLQMVLGGFLAMVSSTTTGRLSSHQTYPFTLLAMNGGTAAMLVGFWLRHSPTVGAAGLLVAGASLRVIQILWTRSKHVPSSKPGRLYYAVSFLALLGSLIGAEALLLSPAGDQWMYGNARLAHIHLGILGFALLTTMGALRGVLPQILQVPQAHSGFTSLVFIGMPVGVAGLIVGFLNSSVTIELAAGGLLFITTLLYALNQFQTWLASNHRHHAASDHVLIGTFFLVLTVILGLLVGINSLSTPPAMPFGTLHVVAYTHMAFIGFLMNTAMGFLAYQIPLLLSTFRLSSHKKRPSYQQRLTAIMDRWRAIQISSLNMGAMGLAVIAALTWNVPLRSVSIRVAMWISCGLLVLSILLFLIKLAMAWGERPEASASAS
ncbi:MAG: hypothetical protein NNA20_11095 [Nitrospira sp.]|nr:hypothetical protein [Nitrospira sp.]MCP9443128.1 hypothetical protein [Nitrospira sp.]